MTRTYTAELRFTDSTVSRLRDYCRENNVPATEAIRLFVADGLERAESDLEAETWGS